MKAVRVAEPEKSAEPGTLVAVATTLALKHRSPPSVQSLRLASPTSGSIEVRALSGRMRLIIYDGPSST